jgi:hypothetical protein
LGGVSYIQVCFLERELEPSLGRTERSTGIGSPGTCMVRCVKLTSLEW